MKILYHHRTQGRGVERVHIMGIVDSWQKIGHEVDILSPPGVEIDDKVESTSYRAGSQKGRWVTIARLMPECVFEMFEILYNFWVLIAFYRKIRRNRYDMLFERYYFLGIAGLLMAKLFGIKFVSEINFTSRTPLVRQRTRFIKPFDRLFEKILFRNVDGMVAVSTYLKRQLIEMGVEADKIVMLPNAADPSKFNPGRDVSTLKSRLGLDGKLVVGFVGHFYPWHGVGLLLDSFKVVDSKIKNFVYMLIGSGPTFDEIRRRIITKKLQNRILLVGQIDHSEIPDYVALFDVAVMPNSNEYGSPMKVLEYMAMAKAAVAPRLGPLEDIVQDSVDGMLFDPNNYHQMAEKIALLLSNEELRNDIGHNARSKIESKHNWFNNASKILDLYKCI